jgi:hypothetical protein
VGRPPQAPLLTGPRASGRPYGFVSSKFEMLIRALFKILFKVEFRSDVLGCLLYRNRLHVAPKGKKNMNNEKTKFVHQVAKADLV